MEKLKTLIINNREFLPIVEGAKGIGLSTGITAGHFAKSNAIGTFSGVNTDVVDSNGEIIPLVFKSKNRLERHQEMIQNSIKGIISQAKIAKDICGKLGRIHMNVLWEMGGTEYILNETLSKLKGLVQGIVCGAGLPYKLGDIAAKYKVNYFPIVSSMRTFKILWKRSFNRTKEWLGGVVYECPWRAGGHNGLTNAEDPEIPQDSYGRIVELRSLLKELGLATLPIIIAGGIWNIKENERFLDNPDVGPIAFQFGTRPIVTLENPASDQFKQELLHIKEEDVITNHFSPTGFYSCAIKTPLLDELLDKEKRQIPYSITQTTDFNYEIKDQKYKKVFYIKETDRSFVESLLSKGFNNITQISDDTLLFLTETELTEAKQDIAQCCGCLSQCKFSTWSQYLPENNYTTGRLPDFSSFCIQKALQYTKLGIKPDQALHFAGKLAYRFAEDPMYKNNHIPSTKELIDALLEGK